MSDDRAGVNPGDPAPEASAGFGPALPTPSYPALSPDQREQIRALAEKADQLVEASLSANTRLAYGKAWRAWSDWCLGFGLDPTGADPATAADERWLVMHLTALSEKRSLATILLRRAAVVSIRKRLKRALLLDDAEFEAFLKGLRRTKGARPVRKAALLEPNLRAASLVLTPKAHPDLGDIGPGEGEGRRDLRDMALLPIDPATIARVVKRAIARTGEEAGEFSAHSLRAGMMTAADQLGVPFEKAMEHGRWKSYASARIYRRHESLWVGNFTGRLLGREE